MLISDFSGARNGTLTVGRLPFLTVKCYTVYYGYSVDPYGTYCHCRHISYFFSEQRTTNAMLQRKEISPLLKQHSDDSEGKNGIELLTTNYDRSPSRRDDELPFQSYVDKNMEEMLKRRADNGTGTSQLCRRFVDRMQRIYLPRSFSSYLPVPTDDFSDRGTGFGTRPPGRIPLVQGLDKVVQGTNPAAEVVTICGIRPLKYLWFMLGGLTCDIIQFLCDFALFKMVNISDPSTCWVLGFGISIIFRHTAHRYLVFGAYVGGYWRSLVRMYTGYSFTIVMSTLFNIVMTKWMSLSHYFAWTITLLWTGVVNYFVLKRLWAFDNSKKDNPMMDMNSIKNGPAAKNEA